MNVRLRQALLATTISLPSMFTPAQASVAQEATFVRTQIQVGVPTYNIFMTGNTNAGAAMIYDTLVVQDADQSFHPGLAESWEEAAEGISWVFHLKTGVKFLNNEPFNAAKVVQ